MDNEMGSLGNLDFKDMLAIMMEEANLYALQMTEWHITWPSDQYLFAFNMN